MPHLKIVPKPDLSAKEEVKRRIRRSPRPAALIQCHRCGGREVMTLTTGMLFKDGKATGGTKQIACASCYMKGERVILL